MNYSNAGMWGKANYFAFKSSYSNGYAHVLATGERQMFMAQVIVGKEIVLAPNNQLLAPPL